MAESLIGRWITCLKLWPERRLGAPKLLKSPRIARPQSGYLFRRESIVFTKYSSKSRSSWPERSGGL